MPYRPPSPAALFNPALLWMDFAFKSGEMLASSGQVIGSRLGRISRAGANPSARDRREMMLMGTEKVQAATQSGLAVAARMQSANMQLMTRAWQQWFASLNAFQSLMASRGPGEALARQAKLFHALSRSGHSNARISADTARLASAALKPVHRASTANAGRLARLKSR